MALQNIGASNKNDAFYRYKMPKLVTKIEGRGNGVKTNLVNMVDVAKALARPPSYITKYFGCELGAQSKFDEKTGTAIVNGSHDSFKLVGMLENFIKKYVQCYECGNPETEILITKNQLVILKCAACGFLSDVNMRDKLTTYILKNPPEQKKKNDKKGMRNAEKERMREGEALDEEMRRAKKEIRRKKSHEGIANGHKKKGSGSESDEHSPSSSQADETEDHPPVQEAEVQWQTDTSVEAVQQRIKEQLTSATSEMVMLDIPAKLEDATVKHEKSSPKSIPPEKLEAVCKVKEDFMPFNAFEKIVKDLRGSLDRGYGANELAAQLQVLQCQSSEQEVMDAFFEALFGGSKKGLAKDIGGKKPFLLKVISGEHSQELLLGAVEAYYLSRPLELRKDVASVLKHLYDLDVLEEDVILSWYDRNSDSAARELKKMAEPFVEWLKTAESEDDE